MPKDFSEITETPKHSMRVIEKKPEEQERKTGVIIKGKSDTQRAQEKVFNSDEPVSLGDLLR